MLGEIRLLEHQNGVSRLKSTSAAAREIALGPQTFLHLLAQICAVRTTEYLLNRIRKDASLNFEAYVNATDASGRTALHHAIIGKNIKEAQHFLKLLFDNKGNPNCIDSVGMSALVSDSCILHRHQLDILTYSCSLAPLLPC